MKQMLTHSFVLNALDSTGADTFSHFEMLIEEHRAMSNENNDPSTLSVSSINILPTKPSRLQQLVPTVGTFHTRLPLRRAFEAYNAKYGITARKHVCISFNEIRHICNLAQIMALHSAGGGGNRHSLFVPNLPTESSNKQDYETDEEDDQAAKRWSSINDSPSLFFSKGNPAEIPPLDLSLDTTTTTATTGEDLKKLSIQEGMEEIPSPRPPKVLMSSSPSKQKDIVLPLKTFKGPKMISFDGDQTLYSDGANFDSNPKLATYLYLLLRHGVSVAVVTAAGYEYQTAKYELRLSGLLSFFKAKGLPKEDCERFYLFGGECNYLLNVS